MWHLALFILCFEHKLPKELDRLKLLKLALTHDIVELYAGDTFAFDKAGRIVLPSDIRHKMHITSKTKLLVVDLDDKIILEKLDQAKIAERLQNELKNVDIDRIVAEVGEEMNEKIKKETKDIFA